MPDLHSPICVQEVLQGFNEIRWCTPHLESLGALKVKFFAWLALRKCIWMADRRHRHGLQHPAPCVLCDQELETPDHLFVNCSFAKQVWHAILGMLGARIMSLATPTELMD